MANPFQIGGDVSKYYSPYTISHAGAVPSGGIGTGQAARPKGLGQVGGALGILGGALDLFGSHGDNGASDYEQAMKQSGESIAGLGNSLRAQGGNQFDLYGTDNANYRQAAGDYANILKADPFTDQKNAADVARTAGDTAGIYARTRAALLADGALRGGEGYGQGNSYTAGALGANANNQANALGQAQNQLFYTRANQRRQNAADLTGLYSDMAGQDYNRGMGTYNQASGDFSNAGDIYQQLYQQALQKSQAQAGSQGDAIGGIIGGAAKFF